MVTSNNSQVIHTTIFLRKIKSQTNHVTLSKSYEMLIQKICKLLIQCVDKKYLDIPHEVHGA